MVDQDDFGERQIAGDGLDGGGVVGDLQALGEQPLVDDVIQQSGFAGAGDAAQADQTLQREAEREVSEVVLRRVGETHGRVINRHRTAALGDGDGLSAGKVASRDAKRRRKQGGNVALEDHVTAAGTGLGSYFNDVVRGADHRFVVLDDDDGVAGIGQGADDRDESLDVPRVQADAGFVEDEERVDERSAEAAGEVDALDFAAGKGFGLTVEREVAEADLLKVTETGEDRNKRVVRAGRGFRFGRGNLGL